VFTYELLSALRGGADVNRDRKIEYSELYAFLSAANRDVIDPRARLAVVAHPPSDNARTPIVNLDELATASTITGIPPGAGQTYFEQEDGRRLADVHVESGGAATIILPAETRVYVHCRQGETSIRLEPRQSIAFDALAFGPPSERARGALDTALRRGLFRTAFGANYYRGFIDREPEFVSVSIADGDAASPIDRDKVDAKASSGSLGPRSSYALYFGGGIEQSVAKGLDPLASFRFAVTPNGATGPVVGVDGGLARADRMAEWRGLVSVGYRLGLRRGGFVAFAGASAVGGVLGQRAIDGSQASSPALGVAPFLGAHYDFSDHLGVGLQADAPLLAYQRDGRAALSLLSDVFAGLVVVP
jgi:hypothetical protein